MIITSQIIRSSVLPSKRNGAKRALVTQSLYALLPYDDNGEGFETPALAGNPLSWFSGMLVRPYKLTLKNSIYHPVSFQDITDDQFIGNIWWTEIT